MMNQEELEAYLDRQSLEDERNAEYWQAEDEQAHWEDDPAYRSHYLGI